MAPLFYTLRLLSLLLFAAVIAAALCFSPQADPWALALAGLGGFVVALAYLRHAGLALAAALAPFPGILWFGNSAYALIVAFSLLATGAYADALLKDEDAPIALAKPFPALAGAVLFAIFWSLHVAVQLQSLLATAAATILFLPALILAGFRLTKRPSRVAIAAAKRCCVFLLSPPGFPNRAGAWLWLAPVWCWRCWDISRSPTRHPC